MDKSENDKPHGSSYATNLWVWAILLICTSITVTITEFDFQALTVAVALTIATIKAALVAVYFMHLKFDNKILTVFLLVVMMVFLSFIILTFVDYIYRI